MVVQPKTFTFLSCETRKLSKKNFKTFKIEKNVICQVKFISLDHASPNLTQNVDSSYPSFRPYQHTTLVD